MYEKKLVAMRREAADVKGIRYSHQLERAMLDESTAERGKPLDEQVRDMCVYESRDQAPLNMENHQSNQTTERVS